MTMAQIQTMKEIIVHPTPTLHTTLHTVPIPTPRPNEVVIRVIVAGSNVKDWLHLTARNVSLNSGDDIAGVVHAVGTDVEREGRVVVGDRVAAFHPMGERGGAYAEFAVAPVGTVFRLPGGMRFEEAATIPLVLTTAALTLFRRQHLPSPSSPTPLIIYGASSALGTFTLKLARLSNIHPILAIAGASTSHLLPLLSPEKGDVLLDYRVGEDAMVDAVRAKLEKDGLECFHAVDAISSNGTWIPVSKMLAASRQGMWSYLSVVSSANRYEEEGIKEGVRIVYTYVGAAHEGAYKPGMPKQPVDLEEVKGDPEWVAQFFKYVEGMLADESLTGHPWEVVDGGLEGVEKGLNWLKEGRARGVKYVYRIGEV